MNEFWGELLGTAVLVVLGDGVVAALTLNRSKAQGAGWLALTTGWALAVIMGVVTARAAGGPGFINPVGPLVAALGDALSWDRVPSLVAAQFLGAFLGAAIVVAHYYPHFVATPDATTKLGVFCTAPAIRMPAMNFLSEAIATFVLVFVGAAIAGQGAGEALRVPLGGALVWAIGLGLGGTTGYAINPARDLGPRLAHAVLPIPGKGPSDWAYAWVPLVGPLVGGVAAALVVRRFMLP